MKGFLMAYLNIIGRDLMMLDYLFPERPVLLNGNFAAIFQNFNLITVFFIAKSIFLWYAD